MTAHTTMNDHDLWAAFSAKALPSEAWTHQAHLRIAWMHLARHGGIDEAHLRMRVGIILLNAAHGLEETPQRGYHETLTRVWLELVRAARLVFEGEDSRAFVDRHPSLGRREEPLTHYSRARLFSPQARAVFVEPDLAPLP